VLARAERVVRFAELVSSSPKTPTPLITGEAFSSTVQAWMDVPFHGLSDLAVRWEATVGVDWRKLPSLASSINSDLVMLPSTMLPRRQLGRLVMEMPCPVWLVPLGWAPVIRRVLVPVDLSDRSASCLRIAIGLARTFPPAKCVAFHVDSQISRLAGVTGDTWGDRRIARELRELAAATKEGNIAVEPALIASGDVARSIGRAADQSRADLIVMTTRGRTKWANWMLASITDLVLRDCACSLLVLKSADKPLGWWGALGERLQQGDAPQFS
jgi:nucleotide-binding universal stress UspA family protein